MAGPVQVGTPQDTFGGNNVTPTLTGVTAGNLLTVICYGARLGVTSSPPAPAGWSKAINATWVTANFSGYDSGVEIYYKESASSGSNSCSLDAVESNAALRAVMIEWPYTGTGLLDKVSSGSGATPGATTGSSGSTATTSQANELVMAIMTCANVLQSTTAGITDPVSGYASLDVSNTSYTTGCGESCYKEVTSTGAQSASWSWTPTGEWMGAVVTFKGAGGGGAADQPPDDGMAGFFDDGEYEQDSQTVDLITTIEAQNTVVAAGTPIVYDDPFELLDQGANYDDPFMETFEWSTPLQPNAPNPVPEDPWYWGVSEDTDVDFYEDISNADLDPQVSPDVWDWFADDGLDDGALLIVRTDEDPLSVDVTQVLTVQPEWDWHSDDAEVFAAEDAVLGVDVLPPQDPPVADGWDWFTQAEDDQVEGTDVVGADRIDPPYPDEWNWHNDDADVFAAEDVILPIDFTPPQDPPAADGWDWFTQAEDDQVEGTDVVGADADLPVQPEWDWYSDDADVFAAEDAVLGADVLPPQDPPVEDGWDWFTQAEDDQVEGTDGVGADYVPPPASPAEDGWDWFTQAEDDQVEGTDVVGADRIDPPVEDGWDWFTQAEDDQVEGTDAVGADYVPPPSSPAEDGWDWFGQDGEAADDGVLYVAGVIPSAVIWPAECRRLVFTIRSRALVFQCC